MANVGTPRTPTGNAMSHTLEALLTQAIDNYPMTATLSPEVVAVMFYALSRIENPETWLDPLEDPADEITENDYKEILELVSAANMALTTPEVGFIKAYITTAPPDNTLACDGGTYAREDYPLLYAVIDAVFIVDADNFTVPDLRGLTIIGAGTVGLDTYVLGQTGGEKEVTLTDGEMPSHTHTDLGHTHLYSPPGTPVPVLAPGEVPASAISLLPAATSTGYASLTSTGGGGSHNNLQPFGVVKYCVQAR